MSVQREKARRAKLDREAKQDAKAAQNGKADPVTRHNMDKRTARKKNRKYFMRSIDKFRRNTEETLGKLKFKYEKGGKPKSRDIDSGVKVYTRKRPLFDYEKQRGEFDIISVVNAPKDERPSGVNSGKHILIHACQMHPDMKRMILKHMKFPCDWAFSEKSTNEEVYKVVAKPLVELACDGHLATIFMYGQTGSGKTFTMGAIEERACSHVFELNKKSKQKREIIVSFFELAGKRCTDLLGTEQTEVRLMDDGNGGTKVIGGYQPTASTIDELKNFIHMGHSRRTTDATDKNATSSRSHAVCQIKISGPNGFEGILTLVDCAGSERKEDSMYHSAQRRKEAAEINASLHALKECIRCTMLKKRALVLGSGKHIHVPFRGSNLTKVLMSSFTNETAQMAVIVTAAPGPTDTEHSISTFRTGCMLSGREDQVMEASEGVKREGDAAEVVFVPPSKWTSEEVKQWLLNVDGGRYATVADAFPSGLDGKQLTRMTQKKLEQMCDDKNVGKGLYKLLRKSMKMADDQKAQKRKDVMQAKENAKYERW